MSYREVANALGINNSPMIAAWVSKFRDDGIEGLSNPKGRPSNKPYVNQMMKKE